MAGSERETCVSTPSPRTAAIRALNDTLRRTGAGGQILVTPGVQALTPTRLGGLLAAVRHFDRFDAHNDPWFEHDMGTVAIGGDRYFWKIDYYDTSLEAGSPDPADPAVTTRILTIMRSDEY
jgi:hypothetical protein